MLTKIEVLNYKSIAQTALTFGTENVIVGPNGAGKSNLLDAIHFLRDAASDGLDHAVTKRHGIVSIRRWSKFKPYHISIKLTFESGDSWGDYRVVISSAAGDFSVVEEEGTWFGPSPFFSAEQNGKSLTCSFKRTSDGIIQFDIPENVFGNDWKISSHESELLLTQFGPSSFMSFALFFRELREEVISCGAYSIYPNKIREPQTISNSDVLADDGTNLASIIRQMRATSSRANRESLTSSLKQVLPIVNEIQVKSAGGFYVPVFRVKEIESASAHDLNMSQISDGTLRMLGMLTAFYQPNAPLRITLEEPEQMIHPGLLPVLIDAARDYLDDDARQRQMIVTTHSPNLLDMFEPSSIIGANYEDGVSSFSTISERQLSIVTDRLFSAGELLVAEGFIG
jgi:predicted ATPase